MMPRASNAARALLLLALSLGLGIGCNQKPDACADHHLDGCLTACDRGDASACRILGLGLVQGQGAGLRTGAMFLERACLAGDASACERLATLPVSFASTSAVASASPPPDVACPPTASSSAMLPPPGLPLPPPLPLEASREAVDLAARCSRGEGVACTLLGHRFAQGIGVPRSPERATRTHALGCKFNDALGCRAAGRSLVSSDPQQASVFLRRGCMGADPGSCATLGELALRNAAPGLTPPYGVNQLRSACTNAYAPACRHLALLLREGKLVPQDKEAAERIEGRSLDLVQQSCARGILEDCVLLGLWQERPRALGDDPGDALRTTDSTSLDGALASYQKACEGGLPAGCSRAIALLDAPPGRREPAAVLWERLDGACSGGDVVSCAELVAVPGGRAPSAAALARACELALPRACVLLAEQKADAPQERAAILKRACRLGDGAGCEAYLEHLERTAPGEATAERQQVCEHLGGGACVALARAAQGRDEACARRFLLRACEEAPERTAQGCAEAAAELRPRDAVRAAELDRLACRLGRSAGPLRGKVAESCGHLARARVAAGQAEEAEVLATASCEAGAGEGCAVLATLLRSSREEGQKKRGEEAARKACQQGIRAACEQRFGPLPAPPASAPARLPSFTMKGAP
jgi:TPR repeat protein